MNPASLKPKPLSRKISSTSPSFPNIASSSRQENKTSKEDLLRRFQENPRRNSDDIFGANEEPDFELDDNFKTLKIGSKELETIRQSHQISQTDSKKSIKFEGDFLDFNENDFANLGRSSFNSISTSSPKQSVFTPESGHNDVFSNQADRPRYERVRVTKESLSEFSEGDDTDITSQMNDEDFEDLDNIFGAEESGIYDKMNKILIDKKSILQRQADKEEAELLNRMERQQELRNHTHQDANVTLKIKDFNQFQNDPPKNLTSRNLSILDSMENERTVNYEYTRDDFDEFEDGFDDDFENNLRRGNSNRAKSSSNAPIGSSVRNKSSMPILGKSNSSQMRRFKSNMDIANFYGSNLEELDEDEFSDNETGPGFNYNNNVIRKLDRIPSFYNNNTRGSELLHRKSQILGKYQEQALAQKEKNRMKRQLSKGINEHDKPKIGLVKYLNTNSVIRNPNIPTNKIMKYNATSQRWEGNEYDLLRFDSLNKPSLVTLDEIQDPLSLGKNSLANNDTLKMSNGKPENRDSRNPHMVYDDENRRWINLREDDESIFNDIDDLIEDKRNSSNNSNKNAYKLSSPPRETTASRTNASKTNTSPFVLPPTAQLQSPIRRGMSQFTQRTVSSNTISTTDESSDGDIDEVFKLSAKSIDKFIKEEAKITKKTQHWFNANETYDFSSKSKLQSHDYYWEIRKMVIENE
ncbi:uncharacterized protein RJT20DRAFT_144111 [Scheffersomyces xylosifermentans]|uniref:uncharacterized protein n=1 Tax=Scheffersomyces xylosifermentans TaxID=1304137 RepID=UPI00315D4FD6